MRIALVDGTKLDMFPSDILLEVFDFCHPEPSELGMKTSTIGGMGLCMYVEMAATHIHITTSSQSAASLHSKNTC